MEKDKDITVSNKTKKVSKKWFLLAVPAVLLFCVLARHSNLGSSCPISCGCGE